MTTDVTMVGELTLDEVVHEGGPCHWKQAGGGALYSAVGALAWNARPRISATIGSDYPEGLLERIRACGVDTSPVHRIELGSLGIWLLHESSGQRQQVPKTTGSSFLALDAARPALVPDDGTNGIHVAPQTTEGQMAALAASRGARGGLVVTQDVMIEPFVHRAPYLDLSAMAGSTAFLPSEQELHALWGTEPDVTALARKLEEHAGVRHLVVKRGDSGADVVGPDAITRIPIVDVEVLDTTGAGDAFCGGFLVGLIETGDVVEATIRGAVAASFVVETVGALTALERIDRPTSAQRADLLRLRVPG